MNHARDHYREKCEIHEYKRYLDSVQPRDHGTYRTVPRGGMRERLVKCRMGKIFCMLKMCEIVRVIMTVLFNLFVFPL